jgi:hypothetical protein
MSYSRERKRGHIYGQSTRCIQKRRKKSSKFVDSTKRETKEMIAVDAEQKKRSLFNET